MQAHSPAGLDTKEGGAGPPCQDAEIPKSTACSEKGNGDEDRAIGPDDLTELLSSCPQPASV